MPEEGGGGARDRAFHLLKFVPWKQSFLFIDVIVNKYFHINLQQEEQ